METDLTHIRRWLLDDFKARATPLIPALLSENPELEAFDLMEAVRLATGKAWLKAEEQAYVLDQYILAKWQPKPVEALAEEAAGPRARRAPVLTSKRNRARVKTTHGQAR